MIKHLVNKHNCNKIFFLTGHKDYVVSDDRAEAFLEQMKEEGLEASVEDVFYGNFWYTSGEEFANRILSGELAKPDAVACANDYMAIGLANRLISGGIKVPEQIRVTGYDATKDALYNTISITTYNPDVYDMAARGVNYIHSKISPDVPEADIRKLSHYGLLTGESCGCGQNTDDLRYFRESGSNPNERTRNADGSLTVNDMHGLHESYMFETLTAVKDKEHILDTIAAVSYLLQPYRRFYLVLRRDWSAPDIRCTNGYPESMRCVLRCIPQNESKTETEKRYAVDSDEYCFLTQTMLPALNEERDQPVVFYFLPVHFSDDTLGYAVLQTAMDAKRLADQISTLWLRNVNNSLHMVRIVGKLLDYSIRDPMTGLLNRRGMERMYRRKMETIASDENIIIWVVDMDGLKYINDIFGHEHGDFGIITIAEVIRMISGEGDITVRTGGDEFVMIAAGRYSESEGQRRISELEQILAEKNASQASRLFDISASIGYVCFPSSEKDEFEVKMKEADSRMYEYKVSLKKQRRN